MKKVYSIFFATCLFLGVAWLPQAANASHIAAADLAYVCDTNNPNTYKIILKIYRDCSGITMGTTEFVNYTNGSSYPSSLGSITLNLDSAQFVDPPCVDFDPATSSCNGGPNLGFEERVYSNTFTFPVGTTVGSNQFTIWWQSCCRNPLINTLTGASGLGMYIEAFLDNNIIPCNNSPIFFEQPVPYRCVNIPVVITQGVVDLDGDDLDFSLISAREGFQPPGILCPYTAPYNFATPHPFSVAPTLSPVNGDIFTTATLPPATLQFVAIYAILVNESRFTLPIGTVMRDMQVVFKQLTQCDTTPLSFSGVSIANPDPDSIISNCGDLILPVEINFNFLCNTLASDGSDFRLVFQDAANPFAPVTPVPIQAASGLNCGTNSVTNIIFIQLYQPINKNGTYYLFTKEGNDGNVLITSCGIEMDEFDTVGVFVFNCYNYDTPLVIVNATVMPGDTSTKVWWTDGQLPVDSNYFKEYYLWDINNGGATPVMIEPNYWVKSFEHTAADNVFDPKVGNTDYSISFALTTNFEVRRSDTVRTMHLRNDPANDPTQVNINFAWNAYNGWPNPSYELQESAIGQTNWTNKYTGAMTTALFTKQTVAGTYYVRVLSKRTPTSTAPIDLSFSNKVMYIVDSVIPPIPPIPPPPPLPVIIPNVFTPNGDGINDVLAITNLNDHPNTKLSVINRWGVAVYSTDDYKNDWNGANVTPGDYFYVLENEDDSMIGTMKGVVRVIK